MQDDGTIVFLDFGMVVQVERATRDRILRMALAAAREDVDGIINGMYELGMIDPEISRAEIRDAALQIMEILQRARELEQRRVQEMVQEILDTFYTWPLVLPEELVYFFRAAALLEGIGFRYDPHFNGLEAVKPVVERMRGEILAGTGRAPRDDGARRAGAGGARHPRASTTWWAAPSARSCGCAPTRATSSSRSASSASWCGGCCWGSSPR